MPDRNIVPDEGFKTFEPDDAPGPPADLEAARAWAQAQPMRAAAHLHLGLMSLEAGDLEPALESLRRAVFLKPRHPTALFGLGQALLIVADPGRARAAFVEARRALAGRPDDEPVSLGGELRVGALRRAVEAHLGGLSQTQGERP